MGRLLALLLIVGLIGGIAADIPGVADDPLGEMAISFTSRCFNWILIVLRTEPIWVLMCLSGVTLMRFVATYPHAEKLRENIERERKYKSAQLQKKRDRVRKARRKK